MYYFSLYVYIFHLFMMVFCHKAIFRYTYYALIYISYFIAFSFIFYLISKRIIFDFALVFPFYFYYSYYISFFIVFVVVVDVDISRYVVVAFVYVFVVSICYNQFYIRVYGCRIMRLKDSILFLCLYMFISRG